MRALSWDHIGYLTHTRHNPLVQVTDKVFVTASAVELSLVPEKQVQLISVGLKYQDIWCIVLT